MQLERFKTDIIPLRQKLFATALKWLQQEEDAEDAAQETLLRLWNIREQLDAVDNPGAFAVQTVRNICIDRLRRQKEKSTADDFHVEGDGETPYEEIERKDAVALVGRIIERLPILQQTVIRMRDMEGYELREIAEITGTQVSAVTVISGGVEGLIKYYSKSQLDIRTPQGGLEKVRYRNPNIPPLNARVVLRTGFDHFSFFGYYQLFSMFENGKGPEVRSFGIGLMLN